MKKFDHYLVLLMLVFVPSAAYSQTVASNINNVANPWVDRNVFFNLSDTGKRFAMRWGLDTAWNWDLNILRGTAFMGKENITVARVSFEPSVTLSDANSSNLSTTQQENLDSRLANVALIGNSSNITLFLNDDHATVASGYKTTGLLSSNYDTSAQRYWSRLITATTKYCQEKGWNVECIEVFNEPDYTAGGQGNKTDFANIVKMLKTNSTFSSTFTDKKFSAGNTLNCDEATSWYESVRSNCGSTDYITTGNTHQLAGSFDNFVSFYQTVANNGNSAISDELHNIGEAMVASNYGSSVGIWWGTAERTRGDFCKATFGNRLGYSENRDAWTMASVYRYGNKTQGFIGTSERQALASSFQFVSKDRDVYFNGYGPVREYWQAVPGGVSGDYQSAEQVNAEGVYDIHYGEDVPRSPLNGTYKIMNKKSMKVMTIEGGSTDWGANVSQYADNGQTYQQWVIEPIAQNAGGDYSYYYISSARDNSFQLDMINWSLDAGASLIAYPGAKGACEQWYFEYAGDGFYYIKCRQSALCLEVADGSTSNNANIQQNTEQGTDNQLWRIIPVNASCELTAPATPTGLAATSQSASVVLSWNANSESDIDGYMIYRSVSGANDWNTIARKVKTTSFIDNTIDQNKSYDYKIKAIDKSENISSSYSASVTAGVNGVQALIAQYSFSNSLVDKTSNHFDAAIYGTASYVDDHEATNKAISLDGSTNYIQIPYGATHLTDVTIATWVKMGDTSSNWLRIFDFGNGTDEYMYLTPKNDGSVMRFGINDGTGEQTLDATAITDSQWKHVALTMDGEKVVIYVDGEIAAQSATISARLSDFNPVLNYIGRSQFAADGKLNAALSDFRIYNYALSQLEVQSLLSDVSLIDVTDEYIADVADTLYVWDNNNGFAVGGWGNYSNGAAAINAPMVEKWANNAQIADCELSMIINNLPEGEYQLGGSFIASWQPDASVTVSGVSFYAGNQNVNVATANGVPEIRSINITVGEENSVEFGLKTESTTANWVAVDELYLYFNGTYEEYEAAKVSMYRRQLASEISSAEALAADNTYYQDNLEALTTAISTASSSTGLSTSAALKSALQALKDAEYQYKMDNASEEHPCVVRISNGTMRYKNADGSIWGWTQDSQSLGWALQAHGANNFTSSFMECWCNGWNSETLPDKYAYQQMSGMPDGIYDLKATVEAVNQSNPSATTTGVSLYVNDASVSCSTGDASPQVFTTERAVVDDGSLQFGIEFTSTTASWFGWDDVVLTYYGNKQYCIDDDDYNKNSSAGTAGREYSLAENVSVPSVSYRRSINANVSAATIMLPFVPTAIEDEDGNDMSSDVLFYKFNGLASDNNTFKFSRVNLGETSPNTPYILRLADNSVTTVYVFKALPSSGQKVTLYATEEGNDNGLYGIYKKTYLPTGSYFYSASSGVFKQAVNANSYAYAFRAYYYNPEMSSAKEIRLSFDTGETVTTTIGALTQGVETDVKVYSLGGVYMGNSTVGLAPGIYIVSGKKVVVK